MRLFGWFIGDPRTFGAKRSSQWPKVRAAWLKDHPECVVCGRKDSVEVHHVEPFHLKPELELDTGNLLTLCSDPCHIVYGHGGNWKWYRKDVRRTCSIERGERLRMKQGTQ